MAIRFHTTALAESRDNSLWVAGVCLALAAVALGFLFKREVTGAVGVWLSSTAYNHCFLIIPIAAYMVWDRRAKLVGFVPRPEPRILLAVVVLSLLWLVAAGVGILEARQFVVIAIFQAVAVGALGWPLYRALLAPFLYLFMLVPSGEFLVPWLQDFTARFVVIGLHLTGVPVYADGTIIEIPAGTFVVAEACAGLRFLVASLAFGIFYGVMVYRSPVRRIIFVALSLIVPIIANGFRAFGIVYLANLAGSAEAVMADHIIYGWGFFTAVTILLVLLGNTFSDRRRGGGDVAVPVSAGPAIKNWRFVAVALLGAALAAIGPSYAALLQGQADKLSLAGAMAPTASASWRPTPIYGASWKPVIIGPDKEFIQAFADSDARVLFYMALYRGGGLGNNLVRAQNRIADPDLWHRSGAQTKQVTVDGKTATIGVTEIENGRTRLVIWHFFIVDGKILPDALVAKLYQLREFLFGGDKVDAFVAVATEEKTDAASADNVLGDFLKAVRPLPEYLRALAADHKRMDLGASDTASRLSAK